MEKKNYFIYLTLLLLFIPLISAVWWNPLTWNIFTSGTLTEQNSLGTIKIVSSNPSWKIVDTTGDFDVYIANATDKKTHIGWFIKPSKDVSSVIKTDRVLSDCSGNLIKDNKNKDITLKYETNKVPCSHEADGMCDGYFARLTDASAVNIQDCITLNPTVVYQNDSKIVFEGSDFNVDVTLFKFNGEEFVNAPKDIFINTSNPNKLKYGATDNSLSENELARYKYVLESDLGIAFEKEGWYYFYYDRNNLDSYIHTDFRDICRKRFEPYNITIGNRTQTLYNKTANCSYTLEDNRIIVEFTSDKYIDPNFAGGDGSSVDPYQISNCSAFQDMKDYRSSYFILNNDIDCSDTINWNSGTGFESIGYYTLDYGPFTGYLDGKGYKISHLYMRNYTNQESAIFPFLEPYDSVNPTIKNISFINLTIIAIPRSTSIGLIGGADGEYILQDIYVQGQISQIDTTSTYSAGTSAGLLGYLDFLGVINRVGVDVNINTPNVTNVGGLVGTIGYGGQVKDSYAIGNVSGKTTVGSLIALTSIGIYDSNRTYATGYIGKGTTKGGLVASDNAEGNSVLNSYYDNQTTGVSTSAFGTGKTTTQMKTQGTYSGWDFTNTWGIDGDINSGYPYLKTLNYGIEASDTTPPTLSVYNITQTNTTAVQGNFNATDTSGIDYWWINDTTNFKINQTGFFENNTNLAVAIYYVNISVNDTVGNIASEIIYVNLTEDIDVTPPQIQFVSPTRADGNITSDTSIEINVSITNADDLKEVIYNWNGTNFTLYNDSLVLMYNFDNVSALGENDTYVVDLSGKGNDGVAVGTAQPISSGKYNWAFSFDGTGDYVDLGMQSFASNFNGIVTFSSWVKTTLTTTETVIGNYDGTNDAAFQIELNRGSGLDEDGKIFAWIRGENTGNSILGYVNSDTNINNGEWHHLLVIYNPSSQTINFYLDGVPQSTTYSSQNSLTGFNSFDYAVYLGAHNNADSAGRVFNGSIDEVRIYNRSLSASEVYQLYASNLNKYDTDKWNLYVNQSKNATTGLDIGNYTYQAFASDTSGNWNSTEEREIEIIGSIDTIYPIFSNYYDNNGTLEDSGTGLFNVTLLNTNGTVWLDINNTNITATNLTTSVYNVSYNFEIGEVYNYIWWAYGNGTSNNINNSGVRSYTVNESAGDTTFPLIEIVYPPNYFNSTDYDLNVNYTYSDETEVDGCWWTDNGGVINISIPDCNNLSGAWLEGLNTVTIYINDTSNNVNSSTVIFRIDGLAPTFVDIYNVSIYINESVDEDFNATDAGIGLDCWSVNDTENFAIDCSGQFTNITGLSVGIYWVNLTINDSLNHIASEVIYINVSEIPDTTPPYFTTIPADASIEYGVVWEGVQFEADDETLFDSYSINDTTNFQINSTGFLEWISQLGIGDYYINLTINDSSNNLNSTIYNLNITQNNSLVLGITGTTPITYGTLTDVVGSGCPAELVCSLSPSNDIYGVGTITFNYSTDGNENYTATSITKDIVINQATPSGTIDGTSPITYGTAGDVYSITGSSGDGDCVYELFRDNVLVSDPDTEVLGVGTYNYNLNTTGCQNYSSAELDTFELVVNQATSEVYTYLNHTRENITIERDDTIWLNGTRITGEGNINLYNNLTLINTGNPVSNETTFNSVGLFNITTLYPNTQNYSTSYETWWVNVICTINLTNTTKSDWTSGTCQGNDLNQSRNWTEYDTRDCGTFENVTWFEYNFTEANITYTEWTAFENDTCIGDNMNQTRNRTQYDSNALGCFENVTEYDSQLTGPTYVNTSWGDWDTGSCVVNDLNQSRNLTSYDIFGCAVNITIFEYNLTTANLTNTTKSDWVGVCQVNDLNESRNWTQYDSNVLGCYSNETFIEYNFTTANITYTEWSDWSDLTCSGQQMNQSRNRTQYDSNALGCFENVTTIEYQLVDDGSCDTIAPYFTTIPDNATITYGQDWTGVGFIATDYSSLPIIYSVNDTKFTINTTGYLDFTGTLSAGIYELTIYINDSSNNSNQNSTSYRLTINKGTPVLTLINNYVSWIFSPPVSLIITGNETNTGDADVNYTLYMNGINVTNPYEELFEFGNYTFIYNSTEGQNWSVGTISKLLIVSPSAGISETCRYKKFGVYNTKLVWFKQVNCV